MVELKLEIDRDLERKSKPKLETHIMRLLLSNKQIHQQIADERGCLHVTVWWWSVTGHPRNGQCKGKSGGPVSCISFKSFSVIIVYDGNL